MKNLKKMLASLVVVAMMASMAIVPAFAATLSYEKEAEQLNKVGLYMGIDPTPGVFNPDLATLLDRQTGVVMLLRMFGQEDEAKLLTDEQANSMLAKFTDAGTVADWAKKQVAYAVDKGVVKGYAEDSTFRPSAGLNGKAYSSLMLQQLGYDGDFDYNQAATKLAQVGGLNASQAALFNSDAQLNKDALVGISYGALQAKTKADGKKLVKVLLENGTIKEEDLKAAAIPYADVTSVAAIADVTVDIGAEAKLPATVTATFDNGTTADVAVTWPTVDTSTAGEQTITGTIANTAVTASVKVIVVPAELKVTGSTSGNRKELILNFNRPVADADKAKNVANYKVKKYTVANADLSEDKMTVTLLIDQLIAQQADVAVTVDKDVGFKEDQDLTIKNVKDVNPPEVDSVVAVGNSLVKVTFSEPVQNARSISYYTIDGKSFASSKTAVSNNGKVVSITLKNPLTSDTHKLVVKDKVVDYAGFTIEDNETEFTVVDDKEAPTGVIESATQTKVVVKFSEAVKEPAESDVDTNTNAKIEKLELADDDVTYTINFKIDKPLPASGGKLTIKNLSDYSGNKTDFTIVIEPKYDMEKPEYVSYKVDDNQKKIIIEFDEDVYLNGDYELVDADGDDVAIDIAYDKNDKKEDVKNKVVITRANGKAFDSEKHKLTISGVEDLTPLKNQIAKITVTIDIEDQKAPSIEEVVVDTSWDSKAKAYKNALYIKFNEDVEEDSATDFSNYAFELNGINTIFDLDKDFADIELLSDDKTVCITFDVEDTTKKDQKPGEDYVDVTEIKRLQVDSVKDTAGNAMSRQAILAGDFLDIADGLQPEVLSAAVTDENTITLKIKNKINDKTLIPDDFIIKTADGKYTIEAYDAEYKSGDDEIKLTVNQDLSADAKYKDVTLVLKLVAEEDIDTVNAFEQKLKLVGSLVVTDKYDPTISSVAKAVYDKAIGTYAEIEISEVLDLADGAKLTADQASQFSVKVGGDIVDVDIYYVAPEAKDDEKTEDVDESKARFVIVVDSDKDNTGKTISVDFVPRANNNANAGVILVDESGNALKEQKAMTKKVARVK